MKDNLTEVICILDQSGSMSSLAQSTIDGYNSFIGEQKSLGGECLITTALFNHDYTLLHDHVSIDKVPDITLRDYSPFGLTALMDAVGRTIDSVGERLAATPENERPAKVLVVIMTDGLENASKEYSRERVKEMIDHQKSKYSWEFIFLGANIDAFGEAQSIGVGQGYAMNYTACEQGIECAFSAVTTATSSLRTTGKIDAQWNKQDGTTVEGTTHSGFTSSDTSAQMVNS